MLCHRRSYNRDDIGIFAGDSAVVDPQLPSRSGRNYALVYDNV